MGDSLLNLQHGSRKWRIFRTGSVSLLQSLLRSKKRVNTLGVRMKFSAVTPATTSAASAGRLWQRISEAKKTFQVKQYKPLKRSHKRTNHNNCMKILTKSTRVHIPWTWTFPPLTLGFCCYSGGPSVPLRASVGLDNVFDLPSADGTAGVGHLLEFETTGVAQTHVSTGVDDRVHHVLVTDRALVRPRPTAWWERRWLGEADWWIWGCSCGKIEIKC